MKRSHIIFGTIGVLCVLGAAMVYWPGAPHKTTPSIPASSAGTPLVAREDPSEAEKSPQSAIFESRDRLQNVADDSKRESVRSAAQQLLDAQDRFQELSSTYDSTHQLYTERVLAGASAGELATYQQQLNELREELRTSSEEIYEITSKVNDAYVTERLAALQ